MITLLIYSITYTFGSQCLYIRRSINDFTGPIYYESSLIDYRVVLVYPWTPPVLSSPSP